MAGLLDSSIGKLLFGHTTMMKDRELERQGQKYKGLMDAANTATSYGATMQPTTETTDERGRTVLTGGEQMPGGAVAGGLLDPGTREQFNTNIGQIPAYKNMSTLLQAQDARGQQAMDRQLQGQQYDATHLSANDIRNQQNTDRAYLTEQVKQSNQNLEIGNQLLGTLPKVGDTEVIDYGNMNATQDNQMLMAFAKVINPGEAVGVDEKGAIQGASWMPNFLMQGIAAIQSGGQMPDALRQQILSQYTQALQMNMQKVNQLRQMNRPASRGVYSPGSTNYQGMYTDDQVGNTGLDFQQNEPNNMNRSSGVIDTGINFK